MLWLITLYSAQYVYAVFFHPQLVSLICSNIIDLLCLTGDIIQFDSLVVPGSFSFYSQMLFFYAASCGLHIWQFDFRDQIDSLKNLPG